MEWYVQWKPEVLGEKPPHIASLSTISITCFGLGSILGICSERSVTKSLNHTMAEVSCRMPLSIQENSRIVL